MILTADSLVNLEWYRRIALLRQVSCWSHDWLHRCLREYKRWRWESTDSIIHVVHRKSPQVFPDERWGWQSVMVPFLVHRHQLGIRCKLEFLILRDTSSPRLNWLSLSSSWGKSVHSPFGCVEKLSRRSRKSLRTESVDRRWLDKHWLTNTAVSQYIAEWLFLKHKLRRVKVERAEWCWSTRHCQSTRMKYARLTADVCGSKSPRWVGWLTEWHRSREKHWKTSPHSNFWAHKPIDLTPTPAGNRWCNSPL